MTSELLRWAADRLDGLAGAATPGPWDSARTGTLSRKVGVKARYEYRSTIYWKEDSPRSKRDASYIASMSPVVGKALAAWLRSEADLDDALKRHGARGLARDDHAVTVARAVLGVDA